MSVPTSIANTNDLSEAVSNINILYAKFLEDYITRVAVMPQFYIYREEGPQAGTNFQVNEAITGSGVAHETGEGDDPYAGSISPGYSKTVVVKQRTYSLPLTWFFVYHNKYPEQEQNIIRDVSVSTGVRIEYDLAAPFTYCTATAYTNIDARSVDVSSGDGLSLANAAHTLVNSSSTYRNRVVNGPQLSAGALELAENLFVQQMLDNNGNRVQIVPDTLVVASDTTTFNVAKRLLKNRAPDTAPNEAVVNVYQGAYRLVRAIAIDSTFSVGGTSFTVDTTKSKQWMLVDSKNPGLWMIVTQPPTVFAPTESNGGINFLTRTRTWFASTVYEPCVLDPRFCVISTADGNG